MPEPGYRHYQGPDSHRSGGALHLRRAGDGSAWAHRRRQSVCTGRSIVHRPPRRQSPGQQFLLECLVFSEAVVKDIAATPAQDTPAVPPWDGSRVTNADEEVIISHNWDELRRFMWDYVGIVRTDKRLERALHRINLLKDEIQDYYANFRVSNDLIELRNLVQTAELIVRCAMARKESRGLHYSADYPQTLAEARDTVMTP